MVDLKQCVALTGAGISAESGIPTFRSKGGLWEKYDPMIYASIETFRQDPSKYWTIRGGFIRNYNDYQPNKAHVALAALEKMGIVRHVITQNIDGLHKKAGSQNVTEIHGSLRETYCLQCGKEYLAPDVPDIHGIVVGEAKPGSRYRDELEGLAERYGALDRVSFVGPRTDMRDWLAASEIVYSLCADPPEAFGRTVPEALHLGVPVIGWNHGGVQETLAALFPAGAVRPGDREALFERSRAFLAQRPEVEPGEAFGLTESMMKTLEVYRDVVEEKAP